jgi:hypothetical protein
LQVVLLGYNGTIGFSVVGSKVTLEVPVAAAQLPYAWAFRLTRSNE